ncbi:MAG: hypothetical protein ACE5FM_02870 [Methyloligellaceae bacterium]
MGNTQKSENFLDVEESGTEYGSRNSEASLTIGGNREVNAGEGEHSEPASPQDAAGYIHGMAIELKGIAESAGHSFLAYLLDLVIEESAVQKRGGL